MTRRIPFILIFSLLFLAVGAATVSFAWEAEEWRYTDDWKRARKPYNPLIHRVVTYAMPWETPTVNAPAPRDGELPQASLGLSVPSTSPGNVLGNTYYEYQTNNTMGRKIRAGRHFDTGLGDSVSIVHFLWMDLPGPDLSNARTAGYSLYEAVNGTYPGEVNLTFSPEYCGYFTMEVSPDNRAVIAGHWTPTGNTDLYSPTVWYDGAPGDAGFDQKTTIDSALWKYENPYVGGDRNTVWPQVAFQVRPNGNHITHLTAICFSGGGDQHIAYYYRKEGTKNDSLANGELSNCGPPLNLGVTGWDCPWVYDTLQATVNLVHASHKSGNVALVWVANPPEPGCDTCSVNDLQDLGDNRIINDVYYQISDDYGVSWLPRVNVTHIDSTSADWMPFNDISALWTGDPPTEELHIAWTATDWARYRNTQVLSFGARVFHWAQSFPGLSLDPRAAMQVNKDPIKCSPMAFSSDLGKINLAQCNGNIYISAVDLWDGHNGDTINPDCAQRAFEGSGGSAANGEVVLVISDDNGVTWDLPHNLTNSPTPHCDSATGVVGPCDADQWPSMTTHGVATLSGDDWAGTISVIPRPVSYPDVVGAEWLHIQYVNDLDPGSILFDNSTWQNSPLRHLRVACVAPDQVPVPVYEYEEIHWPNFAKPDTQRDTTLQIENLGNSPLLLSSVLAQIVTGPSGWLGIASFPATIPDGANNKADVVIEMNKNGTITAADVNAAGGSVVVKGQVILDHNGPTDVDTLQVTLIVSDTLFKQVWDTISTGVISLQVASDGQYGGAPGINRGVRMDYWFDPAECDTFDSIPGETDTYLSGGSFAVGGIVDTSGAGDLDTIIANAFGSGVRSLGSVYSLEAPSGPTLNGGPNGDVFQIWHSGKMANHDSTLAFRVTWYAPRVTQTWNFGVNKVWEADQNFMTRTLRIWSNDGNAHDSIAISEIADWDPPTDVKDPDTSAGAKPRSSFDNVGFADNSRQLLYLQGVELNNDTINGIDVECMENDRRFGGFAFGYLKRFHDHDGDGGAVTPKMWDIDSLPTGEKEAAGGYVESNWRWLSGESGGWTVAEFYVNMKNALGALSPWTHGHVDSVATDLHASLIYDFDYSLQPGDTVVVYTVFATVLEDIAGPSRIQELADRGRNFTSYYGCCEGIRGDLNSDGADVNVLDLTFTVDRIFRGGKAPSCKGEGDVNADGSVSDVLDLTFIVDRIFRGGIPAWPCGEPPCNTLNCH